MSQLDALIARSRAPGAFVERNTFTLSRERAVEKQREYALGDPAQFILELVQGAILGGARFIAVEVRPRHLLVAFIGGKQLHKDELEQLFDYLFADHGDPEVRHLVQLAIGLNALLDKGGQKRPTVTIRVESGDGESAVRLELGPDGKGVIGTPSAPLRGTYVYVERRAGLLERFSAAEVQPEESLIEDRCTHTPVPILLNGRAPFGYTSRRRVQLFGIAEQLPFDTGDVRGTVAVPKRPSQRGFQIVIGGVEVVTLELPELGSARIPGPSGTLIEVPLWGVICDDRLRKTADQADVVRDQRFARMLAQVQAFSMQLLEKVTGQVPVLPVLRSVEPEEKGPTKLTLPAQVRCLGPRGALGIEELIEEAPRPVFWLEADQVGGLEGLADPARFPYRTVVLEEGQARSLAERMPGSPMQKLGSAADVEFVRRVMERKLARSRCTVALDEGLVGTLELELHLDGAPPPWGAEGSLPVVVAHTERALWAGGLSLALPGLSAQVSLAHPHALDEVALVGTLTRLLETHAWRALLDAPPDHPTTQALCRAVLATHARPQFVRVDGQTHVRAGLPPEWGRDALVLLDRPLGAVSLNDLLHALSNGAPISLPEAQRDLYAPLEARFGPGGLTRPDPGPHWTRAPELTDTVGARRPLQAWLDDPSFQITADQGVRVEQPGVVALNLAQLHWLQAHTGRELPLRTDDPPELWLSLTEGGPDWLIRHALRQPGLTGWLGLRRPFDSTDGVLARGPHGQLRAVSRLDHVAPCHGLVWSTDGRATLTGSQRERLSLAALQLYQAVAEGLKQRRFGADQAHARAYGMRFAALCWANGRAHLGTARQLAAAIPVDEPGGRRWGTFETWLDTPASQRPPVDVPAFSARQAPTATAPGPGTLEHAMQVFVDHLGRGMRVDARAALARSAPGLRLHPELSQPEMPVVMVGERDPVVLAARQGSAVARELLLLELARLLARWTQGWTVPLDLHAMQQVLLALRLRL